MKLAKPTFQTHNLFITRRASFQTEMFNLPGKEVIYGKKLLLLIEANCVGNNVKFNYQWLDVKRELRNTL